MVQHSGGRERGTAEPASSAPAAVAELVSIFRESPDKHEAHRRSAPLLERLSRDPGFLTEILADYLRAPDSLTRRHYPVLAIPVDVNPWFSLVANCWLPVPDGNTELSTKAIHHHGDLLLTTVTLFGPGYTHWLFSAPEQIASRPGRYRMELIEAAPHPQHHVAFVDARLAHTPFFPPDLSITLALFSNSGPTGWRDRVKNLPITRKYRPKLKSIATALGVARALDIKIVDSFDFYPAEDGFAVLSEREEFPLGPNADHVASLFHVLQRTGNDRLFELVEKRLGAEGGGSAAAAELLERVKGGERIAPRLSPGHTDKAGANFSAEEVRRALEAVR